MKNIKKFLKVRYVFLALVLWYVMRGALNYYGFCWEQKRWLSDEERIDIAIAELITYKNVYLGDGVAGSKYYEIVPFKSVKEFKQKNPDCCEVKFMPDITFTPISDVLFGEVSLWMPEISGTVDTYMKANATQHIQRSAEELKDGF
jgi:hypothetical protein